MQYKIDINHRLIKECKRGSRKAQFEIYKLHSRYLYNVAYNILQHTAEAEDVVQESFLKAFESLKYFKGEVSFSAWIRRIVVNKSIDMLRVRKELDNIDDVAYGLFEEDSIKNIDYSKELVPKIKEAMKKLPTGGRTVFSLYLLEGYDHKEIGEILGISEVSSRTQYMRAKNRMVKLLKDI